MMDIDDGYILWTGIWKGTLNAIHDEGTQLNETLLCSSRKLERSEVVMEEYHQAILKLKF
jgi:hypothetical protein